MASVTVTKIILTKSLYPNKEANWVWNNAHYGKVYVLEVVPAGIGDYSTGYNHTKELEITRQWRKFISKDNPDAGVIGVATELEIHFTVQNLGNDTATRLHHVYPKCQSSPLVPPDLKALTSIFFAMPDTNNNNRIVFVPHIAKNKSPNSKRYDPFASTSVVIHWASNVWY